MPSPLSAAEAAALGVTALHERMDNGELRFRLRAADGSSYIRTEAADGGWQNSHLHRHVQELSVVQRGTMLVAEERDGSLSLQILGAGACWLCPLDVPHNSCLLPGTVVHTVKYGERLPPSDWVACPQLDPLCRTLDVEAILRSGRAEPIFKKG